MGVRVGGSTRCVHASKTDACSKSVTGHNKHVHARWAALCTHQQQQHFDVQQLATYAQPAVHAQHSLRQASTLRGRYQEGKQQSHRPVMTAAACAAAAGPEQSCNHSSQAQQNRPWHARHSSQSSRAQGIVLCPLSVCIASSVDAITACHPATAAAAPAPPAALSEAPCGRHRARWHT